MQFCKLEIFIPKTHFRQLQSVLQQIDAGHIGNYDSCLSYSEVIGTWRPLDGAQPYLGQQNEISQETELKVEVRIAIENLKKRRVVESIPFCVNVLTKIPLDPNMNPARIGRIR